MTDSETADSDAPPTSEHRSASSQRFRDSLLFWFFAWMGTTIYGGVFGLIVRFAQPVGALDGFVHAGFFGAPLFVGVAAMGWAMWISRGRVVLAGLAGGLTGFFTVWWGFPPDAFGFMHIIAALPLIILMGMVGGVTGGRLYQTVSRSRGQRRGMSDRGVWQFTLRDLFLRFTVLAILLSASTWCVKRILNPPDQPKKHWVPTPPSVEQPPDQGIEWPAELTEAAGDDPSE
ncbi:MAG: hypothetical protein HQ582_16215 [Planctomycetes bacterium]|nr:hypothetical protein [Planctomycetota bacterium]